MNRIKDKFKFFVKIINLLKKKKYLRTQLQDTERKMQDANTEHKTQTQQIFELLYAWSKNHFHELQYKSDVLNQVLWLSSHILCEEKMLCYNRWNQQRIIHVEDLLNPDNTRKSASELNVNWLELEQIWESMPPYWKVLLSTQNPLSEPDLFQILKDSVPSTRSKKI